MRERGMPFGAERWVGVRCDGLSGLAHGVQKVKRQYMELDGLQERVIGIYGYGLRVAGIFPSTGRELPLQYVLEDLLHQVGVTGKKTHLCSDGQKADFGCDLRISCIMPEGFFNGFFVRLLVHHTGIHHHGHQAFQGIVQLEVFPGSRPCLVCHPTVKDRLGPLKGILVGIKIVVVAENFTDIGGVIGQRLGRRLEELLDGVPCDLHVLRVKLKSNGIQQVNNTTGARCRFHLPVKITGKDVRSLHKSEADKIGSCFLAEHVDRVRRGVGQDQKMPVSKADVSHLIHCRRL